MTDRRLVLGLAVIGMALGLWMAVMQEGRINQDATLYLEMARRFADGDRQGALSLYNWPFFPWLIAQVHHVTGLGVENSARLLNAILFGVATWGLLSLIHAAGGQRTTLVAGALLLFSEPYIVGDVLPMIMRDQGYWAFYLLGLLFFLHYYRAQRLRDAMEWQLCMLIATLFRVETVSFVLLLPLALLLRRDWPWRPRLVSLGIAYLAPLSLGILVALGSMFLTPTELHAKLGRLAEMQSALAATYQQMTGGLASKAHLYGETILGSFMAKYAMAGLLLTLLAVLAGNILGASGWLVAALAAMGKYCKATPMNGDARTVLLYAAGIHLLNLIVILLTAYLLTGRYVVGLSFILLIFAAFSLSGLYQNRHDQRSVLSRWGSPWLVLTACLMGGFLIDNLAQHHASDNHEQQAVAWVKQHVPTNARIYYDTARLRYYAREPWQGRDDGWEKRIAGFEETPAQFDYLVLMVKRRQAGQLPKLLQLRNYRRLQEFKGKNGNTILVMVATRVSPPAPDSTP